MSVIGDYIVPLLIAFIFIWGLAKGVDVFDCFLQGAAEGLRSAVSILPALICLLTAVSMFKASGAMATLLWAIEKPAAAIGFPREVLPLALMRPISGSGAMAIFNDLLKECGPDSFSGRVASILLGSTETTFYTIAVYYGATKVKNTRHTLAASLAGDLTGFLFSLFTVSLLL